MIQIEAFQAPCCGGAAGQWNEIELANLLRAVQRPSGGQVEITVHTLVFGEQASLQALALLTRYLHAAGLEKVTANGVFGVLGALPILSLNGLVRFVGVVPSESELLAAIGEAQAAAAGPSMVGDGPAIKGGKVNGPDR